MTYPGRTRGYAFGPFLLDPAGHQLTRDGVTVPLKPKAFDTLLALVESRGRLLSKDELLRRVWAGTIVEEASLTQNVYEVRKALADDEHRYIENVSRRGYRFLGEVTLLGVDDARPTTSIAVLPFVRIGSSSREDCFELGIADALITVLTNVRHLVVRPLSAVTRFDGAQRDAVTVARELDAAMVVDGTVQVAAGRVRVTVRLLDAATGEGRWAGKFDEKLADMFALQDAIVEKLATAIAPEIGHPERDVLTKRYTESAEAWQLYLKGRHHWSKATRESLWKAVDFFRAAIAADARYALAWVGVADAYTSLDWYGVLSTRESNPHALAAAEAALRIDDSLAEGHASLAMARQYAWDWEGAESEYRAALSLNPNYTFARQWYGVFLAFMGRFEEAVAQVRRAQELDPVSISTGSQVGLVLMLAGRHAEAAAEILQVLDLDPTSLEARFYLGMLRTLEGDCAGAIEIYRQLPQENPDFRAMLAHAYASANETEKARSIIRELQREAAERYVPPFWLAISHLGLGEQEAAVACLEQGCEDPDDSLIGVKVFPMFEPLRGNDRYIAVLRRMGLASTSDG